MSIFKRKILRCLILDWQMLYGYAARGGNEDEVPDMRTFAEKHYQSLVDQRKKYDSWKQFYISYQY